MNAAEAHSWLSLFGLTVDELRAIAAGCLIGFLGTQTVKFYLPGFLAKHAYKATVRAVASVFGFIPTYALSGEFWLAVIVALAVPVAYKALVAVLYRQWPWLEGKMSAQQVVIKTTADGNIGVKVGDDKTIVINRDEIPKT